MSRPEDIPQDVWLEAGDIVASEWAQSMSVEELQGAIARAIIKAKEDEREEIASEAQWMADQFEAMGNEKRKHKLFFQRLGGNFSNFAESIRARSKPTQC